LWGQCLKSIRKFVTGLGDAGNGKTLAFFDTYGVEEGGPGQGTEELEAIARESVPGARVVTPSFSGRVVKFKGPLADDVLPHAREFGKNLASS
jgi:hypothetical protein